MKIDFYENVLQNERRLRRIGRDFAAKTEGIFGGCCGALDGWIVKIMCPCTKEVHNPGKYYSRKGCFAINVQVIVDKQK